MKKNYVALHNHSHYSTLDGYATIDEYIDVAKKNNMIGIGLADHGTASGLYKFITRAQAAGLIPVPGIEFYLAPENKDGAKAQRPIYYGKGGRRAPQYDLSSGAYTHLTVFAYNNKGLRNLFKLTSLSWERQHFYMKPRIDTNMLAEHSEGLIVTTGCPSSEINKRFLLGQDDKAYEYANRLKSIFGDNFYVELMDHKMEGEELERIITPKLIELSKRLNIEPIITNDSHYAVKADHEAHERILAVSTQSTMKEPRKSDGGNRFAFSTPEYYIKTYDEMKSLFPEEIAERALANTIKLTEKCKDIKLDYDPNLRPEIEIPEGYTPPTYLQKLIFDGFKKKRGHESKEIQKESIDRIREEFEVIHSNDFISYFLVVHDYIDFAHKKGIGVGAGRGSVGGSEIAYLLDISNTDPIRFDLLFERFLSPGRGSLYQIDYVTGESEEIAVSAKKRVYSHDSDKVVYVHELNPGDMVNYGNEKKVIEGLIVKQPGSAPDIDTDFHTEGREEVVQYCVNKYGEENVANIVTFGTFKAKSAFKAMANIYEIPFSVSNKISSFIPGMQGAEASLKDITDPNSPRYNEGADFRNATEDEKFEEIIEMASQIEGRIGETGVHPCGVIISNEPLAGIIPTQVRQDDGKVITQWEYPELEALGLIKMDLLGLELINTIQQTLENIRLTNESAESKEHVREIPDMNKIIQGKMDDPEVYKMLQEGNTVGIFQLGSPGVRKLLRSAKPETFMEIANITALYRPGPMKSGAHTQYADRKAGREKISYIHEDFLGTEVEEILEETFGLMIFQEQIMRIAGRYAGMTPYETDRLRSAVGKKKMKIMMEMKPKFVEGCMKRGASKEAVETLWETIRVFGEYGFNKSHSVSYSLNIYEALYLKAHFPSEFMAAVIQQGIGNPNKVKEYIQEANRMNLKIGPVDINTSQVEMASTGVTKDNGYDIVYGFSGVKQMNDTMAAAIVKERNKGGPYKSIVDLIKRLSKTNPIRPVVLSNLALVGAFDSFGVSRKLVSEKAKMLIDSGANEVSKGPSLFDVAGVQENVSENIVITGEEFDYNDMIKLEADTIGMSISGHPTSRLGHIAKSYNPTTIREVLDSSGGSKKFNVLGTITQTKASTNKKGNRSIAILMDDGHDAIATYLPKAMVDSIEKGEEMKRFERAKHNGTKIKKDRRYDRAMRLFNDESIEVLEPIETNEPYLFEVAKRGWGENAGIVVIKATKLETAPDGSLPYEFNLPADKDLTVLDKIIDKFKDKNGTYIRVNKKDGFEILDQRVKLSIDFIMVIEKFVGKENIITEGI